MYLIYITSGKNGITSFTYKELELLEENGVKFSLFFTKFNKVNLQPKAHWRTIETKISQLFPYVLFNFITLFVDNNLWCSIRNNEVRYFLIARFLAHKLKRNESQVTHAHVQMGDHKILIGYYLKKYFNTIKLSTTIHAHELYSDLRYKKTDRYRSVLNFCDQIFTISDFNKNILISDLKIDDQKIKRMYLYPSFKNTGLKDKIKILVTANWEYKKGYLDIIDAVKSIPRNDFVVLFAGRAVNPRVDLNLPELINQQGLEEKIYLLGHMNKTILELLYSYCDLFILPSKTEYYSDGRPKEREGIPVALMEAISFRMPVISTLHAGIPELVINYLIEEGNVDQLVASINYCLDNLSSVRKESTINYENLTRNFTPDSAKALSNYFLSI
jgi:glycosyltransferase involved in cell wall biosynthesis